MRLLDLKGKIEQHAKGSYHRCFGQVNGQDGVLFRCGFGSTAYRVCIHNHHPAPTSASRPAISAMTVTAGNCRCFFFMKEMG